MAFSGSQTTAFGLQGFMVPGAPVSGRSFAGKTAVTITPGLFLTAADTTFALTAADTNLSLTAVDRSS